jgi:hypothetical protein
MARKKKRTMPREDELRGPIIERPDGFYWQAKETGKDYGPFATLAEAEADWLASGDAEGDIERTDPLHEAEELGISDWIDPDTGVPAEDSIPRIEDH